MAEPAWLEGEFTDWQGVPCQVPLFSPPRVPLAGGVSRATWALVPLLLTGAVLPIPSPSLPHSPASPCCQKADKSALAGKVNRTQFDASMERLNEVIQEMLSRVTGQEQGWHQLQQQLSEELGSKVRGSRSLPPLGNGSLRQNPCEHRCPPAGFSLGTAEAEGVPTAV